MDEHTTEEDHVADGLHAVQEFEAEYGPISEHPEDLTWVASVLADARSSTITRAEDNQRLQD